MPDPSATATVVLAVLGCVGLATTVVAYARIAAIKGSLEAMKSTLETVTLGNEELRRTNDDLRAELTVERKERIHERSEATAKLARLEGQMDLLTGHLGERIADAVVRALPPGSIIDPAATRR